MPNDPMENALEWLTGEDSVTVTKRRFGEKGADDEGDAKG